MRMMENMLQAADLFCRKLQLRKYKVKVKKNPVESMVLGIFLWKKYGKLKQI